jgi:tetratricopeptide (TPR) repeat protein
MTKHIVFISYSHKDEVWKDKLMTQLGVVQQEGLLNLWDDRRISAGEDWYQEIQEAMNAARVAILLVSADYLNSNFILSEEVSRLLERRNNEGLCIYPVIIRPCAWDKVKWLARLQLKPKDGKPLSTKKKSQVETDLASIAKEVAAIIEKSSSAPISEPSPANESRKDSMSSLINASSINFGKNEEIETPKLRNTEIEPETYDKLLKWLDKGIELYNSKKYDEAIPCFDKALEIDPKYILALVYKGSVLSDLGRNGEALPYFDKVLGINPKYSYAWNSKGAALQMLKSYDEALLCFNKAIEFDPSYVFPWYNKGLVLIDCEKFDEAVTSLSRVIELLPDTDYSNEAKKLITKITKK